MFFSFLLALIALITVFRLRGRQTRLEHEVLDLRSRLTLLSKQMAARTAFGPETPTVRAPDPVAPLTDPRLRPSEMRRAGLAVMGLTVAKVFFVDIGELTGLTRVFALLFLGLALAGFAWLDRWAAARREDPEA